VGGDPRLDLESEIFQPFGHVCGGLHLLEAGLGDAVQKTAVGDNLALDGLDELANRVHGILFFIGQSSLRTHVFGR
jgi:hypothetical protein